MQGFFCFYVMLVWDWGISDCLFGILFNVFLYMVQVCQSLCKSINFKSGWVVLAVGPNSCHIFVLHHFSLDFHWLVEVTLKPLLEQQGESSNSD